MRYIDEAPTVAVRMPAFANLQAPIRFTKTSDADFKKHTERLPSHKQFYQRMTEKGFGKDEIDHADGQIRQTAERIERAGEKQRNAPAAGTIASTLVASGDPVDAGTLLAMVEDHRCHPRRNSRLIRRPEQPS